MSEIALHTTVAEGIARVVLDNPPVNVLTRDVLAELRQTLRRLAGVRDLRVLVLSAAGKHFSAGADVAEHMPPVYRDLIPEFVETVLGLADFPLPVIAAVQGKCLGGGFELVTAADIILAEEGAMLGQPEIKLAVFPPAACVLLPALCHRGVAAEMLYGGEPITAAEAREEGLVRRVVPPDQLEASADSLAQCIARHSGAALRFTKRCVRDAWVVQRELLFRASRLYVDNLMGTDDAVAGLAGFLEKRHPVWRHE
jgi:cyclohexa-1,5-dienecarbonyl-CoA hydratase